MDANRLLQRASAGEITDQELSTAADALRAGGPGQDRYTLLLILGRAMAKKHRALIEACLHDASDPMVARLALQILCAFWKETKRYLPAVEAYVSGVPWDTENDVRQMAVSIAGEFLRDAHSSHLLRQLVTLVDSPDEDVVLRSDAYLSLARAMGRDWSELPTLSSLPPFDVLVDPALVQDARRRLENEPAPSPDR